MEEQIHFLKELQATMKHENEHDYDGQASPRFWVIMDYRSVPGMRITTVFLIHISITMAIFQSFVILKNLKTLLKNIAGKKLKMKNICRNYFLRPDSMFLTKEEAKRQLELNHYHYTSKAHTYAMTAWRAPKVEKLLNTLSTFDWDSIEIKENEHA